MNNLLTKRHSSQKESKESDQKSSQSLVEQKAEEAHREVQQEKSYSYSSKWESNTKLRSNVVDRKDLGDKGETVLCKNTTSYKSSQTSQNETRESTKSKETREENLSQPSQHILPKAPVSQKAAPVNEPKNLPHPSSLGTTQLRRDRPQKKRVSHWPYHQWAKTYQKTPFTQVPPSKNFRQHTSKTTPLPLLDRIPQWAKLSALLLGATSIAAIMWKYPLPSNYQQQPSVTTTPLSPKPIATVEPPDPLPQNELPTSVTPSVKTLPQDVPLSIPPTASSLPESQSQTLSVNPSSAKVPSPTDTEKTASPSGGSVPVMPPPPTSQPPLTPLPCPYQSKVADKVVTVTGKADKNTRSNNNTQVAEVRNYLQQRWNPPSGLTQTLEYNLLLNRDGSIERIIPLGNAAGEYINRTNIPLPGERFGSGLQGEAKSKIHVLFTPDGKVQASLER